jgi:hypothetical protein
MFDLVRLNEPVCLYETSNMMNIFDDICELCAGDILFIVGRDPYDDGWWHVVTANYVGWTSPNANAFVVIS